MQVSANPAHDPGEAGNYRLSLILPAWNESETIRHAIREARDALAVTVAEYEIIVVDDGSTDDTADLVRAEAAADPHVRLVQHPSNLGYGAALRTGFQAARLDLVGFTDADCQFDLRELAYVLPLTSRYDVTCGYRIDRQDPPRRLFYSWGYNTLVKLLIGNPVHDIDCALKIFHREQVLSILPECNNFFVNTEMLTRAGQQGLSTVEVGVHHRPRLAGHSKVSLLDIPRTLSVLLPFWWSRVLFPSRGDGEGWRVEGENQAVSSSPSTLHPSPSTREHEPRWVWGALAILLLVASALLFLNLDYPLIEPDEGRYAEIGREMLTSGEWIVPMLNQKPYLDKPPLFYWLLAGSFHLFGTSEQSARLVPALCAFLTVAGTFWFGRRILGARAALLSAFALTLMAGFIHCGRFLILDSVLTLFVSASFFTAHEAIRGERLRWSWWIASAVCCGLGVLTKGPVALVLLAPAVIAYAWLEGRRHLASGIGEKADRSGFSPMPNAQCLMPDAFLAWCVHVGVVLAVIAPWFIAIALRRPEFTKEFFINHHLKRFFTEEYHDNPIWFYLPVLFVGCLPWSLLVFPFLRFLFTRSAEVAGVRPRSMGFFLLWATWCVVFFTLSRGKLPPYVLPALPAVALLLGCYLEQVLRHASLVSYLERSHALVPQRTSLILAGTWLLINGFGWYKGVVDPLTSAPECLGTCFCLASLLGVGLWGRRLSSKVAWTVCGVLAVGVMLATSQDFVPAWSSHRSLLNQSEEVVELLRDSNVAVACCEGVGSVPFALDRGNVRNFDGQSEREVKEFLRRYPCTLLILSPESDLERLGRMVPSRAEIVRVFNGRKARFVLVHMPEASAQLASSSWGHFRHVLRLPLAFLLGVPRSHLVVQLTADGPEEVSAWTDKDQAP
jgi:4-amino-4-deoxy-L-arabinose transferase-like glycosyltransferase